MRTLISGTLTIADATRIHDAITQRLNELKARPATPSDVEHIAELTDQLYTIAKERDYYAQKLLCAKRAFILAFSDPYTPKRKETRTDAPQDK